MYDPTLLIGDVPGISLDFPVTIKPNKYLRLKHRKRWFGGDWELTFYLSDADFGAGAINEFFNGWLVKQVAEYFNGQITFKGVVWEMTRNKDGKRDVRSMNDVYNAVKCIYTTTSSATQVETAYQTNEASISRYLRRELIVYKDNVSSTQAVAEAQAALAVSYDAWPKSTDFNTSTEDGLEITVLGISRLLNNLFCTVTTPNELVEVDAFIEDIYDTDIAPFFDFIELGYIAANSLEVQREQRAPTRVGDLIDALARNGDSSIPYRWRVTSDLQFAFEPLDITPTLEWKGRKRGGIFKVGGDHVTWNAYPGVMVDSTTAPIPAIEGDFLAQRNHQLIEQFSMWQGQNQPQPESEVPTEAQLQVDASAYERMITDGKFDRLHTPGATPGYEGDR